MKKRDSFEVWLWILICINVFLPTTLMFFNINIGNNYAKYSDYLSYIILLFMVYSKQENLQDYNIDGLALWLFLAGGLAMIISSIRVSIFIWPIILTLVIFVFSQLGKKLTQIEYFEYGADRKILTSKKIILGFLLGVVFILLLSWNSLSELRFDHLLIKFFVGLGKAAVTEEVLIRGFLWGYLREKNWYEGSILTFQSAIFLFGHPGFFGYWNYLGIILLVAITFGISTWRTKSVTPGILAHGLINSFISF